MYIVKHYFIIKKGQNMKGTEFVGFNNGSTEESLIAAANVINRYTRYTPTGSSITYMNRDGETVAVNIPSMQQTSKLAKELVGESAPYELANFLSFVQHLSFYFP